MTTRPTTIPRLRAHDHLSRAEFERRYAAMSDGAKAELLDGAVYVASPVSHRYHGQPHAFVLVWLGVYLADTPGLELGDNSSVRLDQDSEPQPDALLRVPEHAGGNSRVDADGILVGAPELVVEIAASSVSYDLHQKLEVYRRNGVHEYVVHRVEDRAIDWFVLREGRYERLAADVAGVYRSVMFPGLWLDAAALLSGDLAAVRDAVARGVADPAHAPFAARVRAPGS